MSYIQIESTPGKRLKYARKKRGLTQEELSKKLNLCRCTIHKLETDKTPLKKTTALSLCKILNINNDWLWRNEGPMESNSNNMNSVTTYLQELQNDIVVMKIYSRLTTYDDKQKVTYILYKMFQDKYDLSDLKEIILHGNIV